MVTQNWIDEHYNADEAWAGAERDHERVVAEEPTWTKTCECGAEVSRWRGQSDVTCDGPGAHSYNAGGQRLRDDWRGNPSWYDDEIGDLEGFEMQHAGEDW